MGINFDYRDNMMKKIINKEDLHPNELSSIENALTMGALFYKVSNCAIADLGLDDIFKMNYKANTDYPFNKNNKLEYKFRDRIMPMIVNKEDIDSSDLRLIELFLTMSDLYDNILDNSLGIDRGACDDVFRKHYKNLI